MHNKIVGILLTLAPVVLAQDDFSAKVYPVFESAGCRGCHVEDGVASGTRLHFPESDASRDRVQAFGLTLAVLVDKSDVSKSLLLNKPTNRDPAHRRRADQARLAGRQNPERLGALSRDRS